MRKIERCDTDELFADARAGSRESFAALVRMHQSRVFGIALRMLMDRALAEDLTQEVFLQLHHSIKAIESHSHLVFWLRQVAARRAIDRVRAERRGAIVPLPDDWDVAAAESESDPLLQRSLLSLIGRLPASARAVMLLRYQEDMDPLDIARTLGISINTVKSHLKRSLVVLRGQLAALAH